MKTHSAAILQALNFPLRFIALSVALSFSLSGKAQQSASGCGGSYRLLAQLRANHAQALAAVPEASRNLISTFMGAQEKLLQNGGLKRALRPEEARKLQDYLEAVAVHSAMKRPGGISDAEWKMMRAQSLPNLDEEIRQAFRTADLDTRVSDIAALAAPRELMYPARLHGTPPSSYQGAAGDLASHMSKYPETAGLKAQNLGEKAAQMNAYEKGRFIEEMKVAEAHDRDLAKKLAERMEGANAEYIAEAGPQRRALLERAETFRMARRIAEEGPAAAGHGKPGESTIVRGVEFDDLGRGEGAAGESETRATVWLRKRADAGTAAERGSIKHQIDMKIGISSLDLSTLRSLGLDELQLENLRQAEIISDIGKLAEGKAIWFPKSAEEISRSDGLISILSGAKSVKQSSGGTRAFTKAELEAQKILQELMAEKGLQGKWLLPPDMNPAQLRSAMKDAPVISGYFHEMPGIQTLFDRLASGKINAAQFRDRLRMNLFHNTPNEGYWKFLGESMIPQSIGRIEDPARRADALNIFKGTVFESDVPGKAVSPEPWGGGLIHAVYDRLSQGTGGGMLKIKDEIIVSKAPVTSVNIIDQMVNANPQGTMKQLARLGEIIPDDPLLGARAKETLSTLAENARLRVEGFQNHLGQRIKVVKKNGKVDHVLIDGKKYTDADSEVLMGKYNAKGEKIELGVFDRVVAETEEEFQTMMQLDRRNYYDKFGRPIPEKVIANAQLPAAERSVRLKEAYAAKGYSLDDEDLKVLMRTHERGSRPVGHQNFASLRQKLSGDAESAEAGAEEIAGFRKHFQRKFTGPDGKVDQAKYREFLRTTKSEAMDTGLLGTLPGSTTTAPRPVGAPAVARPTSAPTTAARLASAPATTQAPSAATAARPGTPAPAAPSATQPVKVGAPAHGATPAPGTVANSVPPANPAAKVPPPPALNPAHKPDAKAIERAKKALGAERVEIINFMQGEYRFRPMKNNVEAGEFGISEAKDGYLTVTQVGREVFSGREPKALIFNPDLLAEFKRLKAIEEAKKLPLDAAAKARLEKVRAEAIHRWNGKLQKALDSQILPAFEGKAQPKLEASRNFVVADAAGKVDYTRLPTAQVREEAEAVGKDAARFAYSDSKVGDKSAFQVHAMTESKSDRWNFRARDDGSVVVEMLDHGAVAGKEPQFLIHNPELAADIKAYLALRNLATLNPAQAAELKGLQHKILRFLPANFQEQIVPTLRGDLSVAASIVPQRAPATKAISVRTVAGDSPMTEKPFSDFAIWDPNAPHQMALENKGAWSIHEKFAILERQAPDPKKPPTKSMIIPGGRCRNRAEICAGFSARMDQLDHFVDDHLIIYEAGKSPRINPDLGYAVSSGNSGIFTFGKQNANKYFEGLTIVKDNGNGFARVEFAMPDGKGGTKSLQFVASGDDFKTLQTLLADAAVKEKRDLALIRIYQFAQDQAREARRSMGMK